MTAIVLGDENERYLFNHSRISILILLWYGTPSSWACTLKTFNKSVSIFMLTNLVVDFGGAR